MYGAPRAVFVTVVLGTLAYGGCQKKQVHDF